MAKREARNRDIYLYDNTVEAIDDLVKRKYYPTRSSFVRHAIECFLKELLVSIEIEEARKIAEEEVNSNG